MVSRANTRIAYAFTNTGDVAWDFYVWAYIYNEADWNEKIDFLKSSRTVGPGASFNETLGPETVDLIAGNTYRAVIAIYKDATMTQKLADANSSGTISVAGQIAAQITSVSLF